MPATRLRIFISSVQNEFAGVREDLKAFLLGDPVLRRFISHVFLFEDVPARDRRADELYLEEVEESDIYIGIFGDEYGYEDEEGISPTEREFEHAGKCKKTRLIYIWGEGDENRHPKMMKLISKVNKKLIRRRVQGQSSLTAEVYNSLVEHLDQIGALQVPPFDTSAPDKATLTSLSRKRIDWFLETASRERKFALRTSTETKALLKHLNLLSEGRPTNAAILLFGSEPQRFHRTAETKCVHSHGTKHQRPFASDQIFDGDLFSQADQSLDFVLSKIARSIGTRGESMTAPATYELPPEAISEAIINALAHRDYNGNGSVEVRLFSDRLEIWNPGTLPGTLTTESLREDHPSVPANPLLAESLYLARYIEKVGSGTQAMIEKCREAGLPEPDFEIRHGSFVVTLWRDWLTPRDLDAMEISERQRVAIDHVKRTGRIANSEYQEIAGVTRKTAARDLDDLVEKGVFRRVGEKRATHYVIAPSE